MRLGFLLSAVALWSVCQTANAQTEAAPRTGLFDSVMLYTAQGVNHNLRELPGVIVRQDVQWESSYFTALALDKSIGTLGGRMSALKDSPLENVQQGYEIVLAQHRGLQNLVELGVAWMLRTPDWALGPVAVNLGTGLGLSHAFGTPSYEDGPTGDPDKRYQTQLLVLVDIGWKLRSLQHFTLLTRVHHRSGAYGLLAPSHVGSNFLAVGLRYDF